MMATGGITQTNQLNLRLESTLQELPCWQVYVEIDCPGNDLVKLFKQEPLLPGIILQKDRQYVGMISRRKFFEQMSHPYSLSLFSLRPIKILYKFFQQEILELSEDISIVKATQLTLQRSHEIAYEPILVKSKSGKYKLLDFHQLLLGYSQIHVLTLVQLQHVEEQSRIAKAGFRDLKQNYSRLIQNEKMAALGQLVAGIAHEINNPVNFIAGNLVHAIEYSQDLLSLIRLYQECYPEPATEIRNAIAQIELDFLTTDLPRLLSSMKIGTKRIEEIILSLRNFSRLDESEKKLVDIHEGIDSTLLILQSRLNNPKIGKSITLIQEYGNLPLVECYPGLLNQVFMNILANAIDALEERIESEGDRGENLTPSLLHPQCPITPQIRIYTELSKDKHVIIRIVDNGLGIPEHLQERLFDPFFTTKPVGKGTGLGLSISYQIIVEKHNGQLECMSLFGQGTEFIIKIPIEQNSLVNENQP
ncbi:MAG: ATP-binding protein [Nostoc sp. ChiSLP02]|nr:ATP-binding protein [Nostoc sp. DedSLP05]MDZ8100952.1 ATP-binding protein [Nostoc sp. DedSLP01]MDZ8189472.1 ATP-binding protein [Nostoc sp. ChiSLP02]